MPAWRRSPAAPARPKPGQGHGRHRDPSNRRRRRPSLSVRRMRARASPVHLLPEPALPSVPGCRRPPVDEGQGPGHPAGPYLPRRLHHVGRDRRNRKTVLDILFRTATETLRTIAADPRRSGILIGGTAMLHTWNQRLLWHSHLHCVVPSGGFDVETGDWKTGSGRFLAPSRSLPTCSDAVSWRSSPACL